MRCSIAVNELSILCGTNAVVIIFSPYDKAFTVEAFFWTLCPHTSACILTRPRSARGAHWVRYPQNTV
jgi:hypothetical protein